MIKKIALAYFQKTTANPSTTTLLKMSLFNVCGVTTILVLALAIMRGFEYEATKTICGVQPSAILFSPGKQINFDAIQKKLIQRLSRFIKAASPFKARYTVIQDNNYITPLLLRGINPTTEATVSNIENHIKGSNLTHPLQELLNPQTIILGKKFAEIHKRNIGETITLGIATPPTAFRSLRIKEKKFTIVGIFDIGIEEYDESVAYCDIKQLVELFPDRPDADGISLKFHEIVPPWKEQHKRIFYAILKQLGLLPHTQEYYLSKLIGFAFPNYKVLSWEEMYPTLFKSLKLQRYAIGIITCFLLFIALSSVASLLFLSINTKERDIALFVAIGMPYKKIKMIFFLIGMFTTNAGLVGGICLGTLCSYIQNHWKVIPLPGIEFIEYLPIKLHSFDLIFIIFCTNVIGIFIITRALKRINSIPISAILRQG